MNPSTHTGFTLSLHNWMGFVFVALAIFIVILPALRKRSVAIDNLFSRPASWLEQRLSDQIKKRLMLAIALVAGVVFAYCLTRSYYSVLTTEVEQNLFQVLHAEIQ